MKCYALDKLSIIVIVYNVENYLEECIHSVVNQSYKNLEIILVNDGSTDNSGNICNKIATLDKRVIVVHKENGGLVSARQAGIKKATGKYVAFVDGDDWIELKMYEELYLVAKQFSTDIVLSGIIRERKNKSICECNLIESGYYDKKSLETKVYPYMMYVEDKRTYLVDPSLCNKLFELSVIKDSILQVNTDIFYLGEDAATIFPCLLRANSIYVTDFCLYHHRIIEKSTSLTYKREKVYERLTILYNNMKDTFEILHYSHIMRNQLNGYFLHMLNMITLETINLDIHAYYCRNSGGGMDESRKIRYKLPSEQVDIYQNIILYGAGNVGRDYFSQMKELNKNVVLWIDKRYDAMLNEGLPIAKIENIFDKEFDIIIVAAQKKEVAMNIRKELLHVGILKNMILWIEPIETIRNK